MRSYGDLIEVRRGLVAGQEVPAQFLWRGKLWKVREVIAHWVETGAWWEQPGVAVLLGAGSESGGRPAEATSGSTAADPSGVGACDLLAEREHWRVDANRGRLVDVGGVFDLAFDWADGHWRLVRCVD